LNNSITFEKLDERHLEKLHNLKIESKDKVNRLYLNNLTDQKQWFQKINNSPNNICLIAKNAIEHEIGVYFIKDIDWINRHHDFTYYVFPEHRGKGLGVEVLKAGLHFSFSTLNLDKVYGEVLSSNKHSRHIMEKCGFVQVGIRYAHLKRNNSSESIVMMECHRT
jgi:UDP-4-amino-4,6-dideoxy-N-acetyl-beta-L-altrosamine N-acetyltransferase